MAIDLVMSTDKLPHLVDVEHNVTTVSDTGYIGPQYEPGDQDVPCLISWGVSAFEGLFLGTASNISAVLFAQPDIDIRADDRLTATIGGQTYIFVVDRKPFIWSNPLEFPNDVPHHQEAELRLQSEDES